MFAHRQIGGNQRDINSAEYDIRSGTFENSRILNQLKADFGMTRSLQREFHEVLIDPGTVSLSKDNRGLRNVFKRSGLNNSKIWSHWKYLLAVLAEALYPPTVESCGAQDGTQEKMDY